MINYFLPDTIRLRYRLFELLAEPSDRRTAIDVAVTSYISLDCSRRHNLQSASPFQCWLLCFPPHTSVLHQRRHRRLALIERKRARMCSAFPSDELCSRRGVKQRHALFIAGELPLNKSGALVGAALICGHVGSLMGKTNYSRSKEVTTEVVFNDLSWVLFRT